MLLKSIKALTYQIDGKKEFEMSLVEAMDKFYKVYQTKDMTNIQFWDKFSSMVDVIKHYGGTIGVYWKVTEKVLAQYTSGVYDNVNWRSTYTDQ
jgi:hypothetical protein